MSEITVHHGDSREVLKSIPDCSIDSIVTDPPYALVSIGKRFGKPGAAAAKSEGASGVYKRASAGFMGQQWDTGEIVHDVEFWAECFRVLKPGGHLVAFSATRTQHRQTVAIEDAGFEIRDMLAWLYGSGFPKSHDVAKGIDAKLIAGSGRTTDMRRLAMGDEYEPSGRGRANFDHGGGSAMNGATGGEPQTSEAKEWVGWGTALKPALEPIVLARKPLSGTVAANVLAHGTGALNIDGCRIGYDPSDTNPATNPLHRKRAGYANGNASDRGSSSFTLKDGSGDRNPSGLGRWPANVIHDGSDEVVEAFPNAPGQSGTVTGAEPSTSTRNTFALYNERAAAVPRGDSGSAARFFYSAKADAEDRLGSKHPTVKPTNLMRWLVRLITPPGGTVLDPFAGSGSTGIACIAEGFNAILIEREEQFVADVHRRLAWARGEGRLTSQELARNVDEAKATGSDLPLFGSAA